VAYRADIEIAVKGANQIEALKQKLQQVSAVVERLANQNIGFSNTQLQRSNFFVAQERKLIAARKEYNKGLQESIRLAVEFDQQVRRSFAFASSVRKSGERTLSGSRSAGLLPEQAASGPFRRSEQKAARIDSAYARLAAAAEGTTAQFTRIAGEGRRFKALPAAGEATVNYFQIAETAARAIDKQNAANARYTAALNKLTAAAEGTISNFVRFNAGVSNIIGLLSPQRVAGLLPGGRGIAGLLPPAGGTRRGRQSIAGLLPPASELGRGRQPGTAAFTRQFPTDGPVNLMPGGRLQSMFPGAQRRGRAAIGARIPGALSGAAIGGAFPLLFGQSGGAAAGGAIGGLAGGLLGPGGSFAGSLIGTILGDIAAKGNVVKKLGEDIGFSAQQTKILEQAFKQSGREFDKFQASVQNIRGLGLDIEAQAESIKLVSTLTEKYGGTIDKVTNAFTSALESGKVTQATLNQLTSQGIPIQQALADKYKVSRSELLQMAKDGKISIQDLTDTLVEVGNRGVEATTRTENGFTRLGKETRNLGGAFQDLAGAIVKALSPAFEWLADKIAGIIQLAAQGVSAVARMFSGGTENDVIASARAGAQLVKEFPELRTKRMGGRVSQPVVVNNTLARGGTVALNPTQKARYETLRSGFMTTLEKPEPIKPIDVTGLGQLPPSNGNNTKPKIDTAAEEKQRLDALLKQLQEEIRIRTEGVGLEKSLIDARADQNYELEAQIQSSIRLLDIGSKQAVIQKNFEAGKIGRAEYTLRLQLLELDRTEDQIQYEEDLNRIFKERYGITDALARLAREARTAAFGGSGATGTFRTDLNLMPGLTQGFLGEEYEKIKTQLEELTKIENQVAFAAESIGQAFGNSFKGIIDGTLTAQQALANFFSSVADSFADMATQMITKWLQMQVIGLAQSLLPGVSSIFPSGVNNFSSSFGAGSTVAFNPAAAFGGFRAAGGSVAGGTSYMVGERGPELFVPGRSGTIVPNDKMGGGGDVNVVVNVDAKGTSVEGNESEGKQLGRLISAAVQSELVKQQRPGGLLSR
jgi:tape measure domain-containing protein